MTNRLFGCQTALCVSVMMFALVATKSAAAQSSDKGPLIVMGDKNLPPYEFIENGVPTGINVAVWRELARVMGRKLDMRLHQWADSQARVKRGEGKILSLVSINEDRRKLYDFTRPTFTARFPIFVREEVVGHFNVDDLKGKRIAVKRGGLPQSVILNSHPEARIVLVDSALDGFRKLLLGEVDGVIESERVGYYYLNANGYHGIAATSSVVAVNTAHIAVAKGNPELRDRIDAAIGEIKANGKFEEIVADWSGSRSVYLPRQLIENAVIIGAAILLLTLIGAGTMYVLNVRRLNTALRQQIVERDRTEEALRLAKEHAEQADKYKSSFLANMSHELRTPLNAILGFSNIMERQMFGPLGNERYNDYVAHISASGAHLLELINDVLDISKLEAGEYELHMSELDIVAIVEKSAKLMSAKIDEKHLHLNLTRDENLPVVRADERAVRQIVLNLLSNAINATPENGDVRIHTTMDRDGCLNIVVSDTGVGIPDNCMETILQPYRQAGNVTNEDNAGTGLGLSIVLALVKKHGGSFQIDSAIGKGTQITVRFPNQSLDQASGQSLAQANDR